MVTFKLQTEMEDDINGYRSIWKMVSWPVLPQKGDLISVHPSLLYGVVTDVWHFFHPGDSEITVEFELEDTEFDGLWNDSLQWNKLQRDS